MYGSATDEAGEVLGDGEVAVQRVGEVDADPAVQVGHRAHRGRDLRGQPVRGDSQVASCVETLREPPARRGGGQFHAAADDVDVGELLRDGLEQGNRLAELLAGGHVARGQPGGAIDESVGVAGQCQPVLITQHRRVDSEDVAISERHIGEGDGVFTRTTGRRGAPHGHAVRVAWHHHDAISRGHEECGRTIGVQHTGFHAGELAVDDMRSGPRAECVARLGDCHRIPGTGYEGRGEPCAGVRVGRPQGQFGRDRTDGRGHRRRSAQCAQQRSHTEDTEVVAAGRFGQGEREQTGVNERLPQLAVVVVGVRVGLFAERRLAEGGRPLGLVPRQHVGRHIAHRTRGGIEREVHERPPHHN